MKASTPAKGNAITEYGIIAGLLALLCIGGLKTLGGSLNVSFSNIITKKPMATASPSTGNPGAGAGNPGAGGNGSTSVSDQLMQDGDSNGGNATSLEGGTVQVNVNTIQTIATSLQNTPNLDPRIVDMLTQLANAGHTVGNTIDQKSQTGIQEGLANYLVDTQKVSSDLLINNTSYKAQLNTWSNYIYAHPQALPPATAEIIQKATSNISTAINNSLMDIPVVASGTAVHQNANTVCSSGGNTGQCLQK